MTKWVLILEDLLQKIIGKKSIDLFKIKGIWSTVGHFLHILIFAKSENEYYIFCENSAIGQKCVNNGHIFSKNLRNSIFT